MRGGVNVGKHDMNVKIRVDNIFKEGKFDDVKTLIKVIEKEYGDSHTLSI